VKDTATSQSRWTTGVYVTGEESILAAAAEDCGIPWRPITTKQQSSQTITSSGPMPISHIGWQLYRKRPLASLWAAICRSC